MGNPLNLGFDYNETKPANKSFVDVAGYYKVKLIDCTVEKGEDRDRAKFTATILEPKEFKGYVIEDGLNMPNGRTPEEKKKSYKRYWLALIYSAGYPEDGNKRIRQVWEHSNEVEAKAKTDGLAYFVLKGKTAYVHFTPRPTPDDFDKKVWITGQQYRVFQEADAELNNDADTEVDEVPPETDELPPEVDAAPPADAEDDDVSVEDEVPAAAAEPAKRRGRPAGSKNKPKDAPATGAAPPPAATRTSDPLDMVDDL